MKLNLLTAIKVRVNRESEVRLALTLSAFIMLNIPILHIGIGEGIDDIALFDARMFVEELSS